MRVLFRTIAVLQLHYVSKCEVASFAGNGRRIANVLVSSNAKITVFILNMMHKFCNSNLYETQLVDVGM